MRLLFLLTLGGPAVVDAQMVLVEISKQTSMFRIGLCREGWRKMSEAQYAEIIQECMGTYITVKEREYYVGDKIIDS